MNIEQALGKFITVLVDPIVTLGFAAALLYFFWGLFKMMVDINNGNDAKEGKSHMLWGLVGMFIMFSVGGIIGIINNTVGADESNQKIRIDGGY